MDYVRLGSAGLKVSRVCLGMMSYGSQAERAWHLDEAAACWPATGADRASAASTARHLAGPTSAGLP